MWLAASSVAEGLTSDSGIVAIVVAAISAVTAVAVAWVRGKRPEPAQPDPAAVTPAIEAAAAQGIESAAAIYKEALAREQADNEELERKNDVLVADRDVWMQRAYRKGWTSDDA